MAWRTRAVLQDRSGYNAAMSSSPDASVRTTDDGSWELRFERTLAAPLESVWEAITEPDQLVGWWAEAELDLRCDGKVVLRWLNTDAEGNQAVLHGRITDLRAPRDLELEGDIHGVLRFELCPDGDHTPLVFTSTMDAPEDALPMVLAGWHIHFDHLEALLAGEPVDWERWDEQHRPRWEELRGHYAASLVV
jgi:uncharacterized protein YndB with AHSA1/START domain